MKHSAWFKSTTLALAGFLSAAASEVPQLPALPKDQLDKAIAASRVQALAKIRNLSVIPQWIEGSDSFWYKREVEGGVEYVQVDAASGARRPLFDHNALAATLTRIGGKPVKPSELPLSGVETKGGVPVALTLIGDKPYRCSFGQQPDCTENKVSAADSSLVLSPDERFAVFVKYDNLWLRETASGRERALTTDGAPYYAYGSPTDGAGLRKIIDRRAGRKPAPQGISWSPDSRLLVAARFDERHVETYPFIENAPVDGSFRPKVHMLRTPLMGEPPPKIQWVVIDTVSDAVRPIRYPESAQITSDLFAILSTSWSSNSRFIYTLAQPRDTHANYLFQIDASSGSVNTVIADRSLAGIRMGFGSISSPFRVINGGRQALWPTARDGYIHVDLYDTATGRRNAITRGKWVFRHILSVDEAHRSMVFAASGREPGNPYYRYIYRIGLDGKDLRLLTPELGDRQISDPHGNGLELDGTVAYEPVSPSGKYVVYGVSTPMQPPRFVIRRTVDGSLVSEFERTDASALFVAGYRLPEEFVATSADGKHKLYGLVYRPSGYDPNRKYPVMDAQYGSPLAAVTPPNFPSSVGSFIHFASNQANAELGFVVVNVDARGTPNRSLAFSIPERQYLRKMGLDDHVAFIHQLAAADPGLDLERVGISGASFGGWTTLRGLIEYPDFFKVGVAITAPGAFHSMWDAPVLTSSHGMPHYAEGGALRPGPTAVPDNFEDLNSPAQVDRIKGKLLIIIGEQDENVYPGSTLQFFDAAVKADKDVTLIQIPNATHGVIAGRYAIRNAWSFVLDHLAGTRLPEGTVVPVPLPEPPSKNR